MGNNNHSFDHLFIFNVILFNLKPTFQQKKTTQVILLSFFVCTVLLFQMTEIYNLGIGFCSNNTLCLLKHYKPVKYKECFNNRCNVYHYELYIYLLLPVFEVSMHSFQKKILLVFSSINIRTFFLFHIPKKGEKNRQPPIICG